MDFVYYAQRQKEFSIRAFGAGERTEGIMKHIEKEIAEVRANPKDLTEYIDIIILAMDAAWRQGYSPQEIEEALFAKQQENMEREWPPIDESKQDQAVEHIRSKEHK